MAGMNAEYINPFLTAATKIVKDMCFIDLKIGKPYLSNAEFKEDTIIIMIGVTGEIRGQVLISFANNVACEIASKMVGMPIEIMDELSKSAIGELGNMILGNTATTFSTKGIGIDITPPTICSGNMSFNSFAQNISVPLLYEENKKIEFNIAIKD